MWYVVLAQGREATTTTHHAITIRRFAHNNNNNNTHASINVNVSTTRERRVIERRDLQTARLCTTQTHRWSQCCIYFYLKRAFLQRSNLRNELSHDWLHCFCKYLIKPEPRSAFKNISQKNLSVFQIIAITIGSLYVIRSSILKILERLNLYGTINSFRFARFVSFMETNPQMQFKDQSKTLYRVLFIHFEMYLISKQCLVSLFKYQNNNWHSITDSPFAVCPRENPTFNLLIT